VNATARTLRPYIARQWKALAGAGGATGVLTAADLAKPWPLALVVDHLLTNRNGPFELTASDWRLLIGVVALTLGIAIAEAIAQYLSDFWLQSAGERITHELRVAAYDHLQRLSLGFHQRRQKGDLVTRVTGDAAAVGELFSDSLGAVVQAALLAIGMTVVLFALDPVLALISLATSPALATISYVYRRRVKDQARVRRRHEGRIASMANEALSAMAVVKAYGSERFESDRVRTRSEERMAAGVEVARLQARFDGLVGAMRAVSTALVLVVGVLRVAHGAINPGELIVFVTYTRKAHNPMRSMAREATKIAAGMARAERVADLLAEDEMLEERPNAYRGPRARGGVKLDHVTFSYAGERAALRDVSLHVNAGTRVAIMGASGAGKSTLGALVARFYDPAKGIVSIDGRDVRDCALAWVREQVAIVLQDTVLFTGSVRENIAYGADATPAAIEEAARAAAAHDFIRELPGGYDTELGPQGVGLSGGQRQRIGIARTLLRNPPILVLDEPTTGLDADAEAQLMDGLRRLMEGRTTILVTHSAELARSADEVVRLDAGHVQRRPLDAALPQLEHLLDADEMRDVLARAAGAELQSVAVSRVAYKPHETVAVHYRAAIDGSEHDVVATGIAGVDLAERAQRSRYRELARRAEDRSPAPPLTYDAQARALVTWLPFDPRLPALAEPPADLLARLRAAGADVPEMADTELLGYKPRGRAVLRLDGHVLKAYGRARQFDAAWRGLVTATHELPLRTGAFAAALPELRLTAQRTIAGTPADDAHSVAGRAGAIVARLQHARTSARLDLSAPDRQLQNAARKAAVIDAVLPELRPRLGALIHALTERMPGTGRPVPAHGDFHVDQLLVGPDGIGVVDFDGLALAAPAMDLATYAADVVRGREGDLEAVLAVLEPLLAGYGSRPADLDWHLAIAVLGRAAHPFQRQVPDWEERVEAMVAVAEAIL
jgi:ATP-binding cassette subfamily B protein/subfamily B ATP-binding cassette protein MsbA